MQCIYKREANVYEGASESKIEEIVWGSGRGMRVKTRARKEGRKKKIMRRRTEEDGRESSSFETQNKTEDEG